MNAGTLLEKTGCLEVRDLGLQFVRPDGGHLGAYYVTCLYWRCDKCKSVVEIASLFERRIALERFRGPEAQEQLAAARAEQDHMAAKVSKAGHAHDCARGVRDQQASPPG